MGTESGNDPLQVLKDPTQEEKEDEDISEEMKSVEAIRGMPLSVSSLEEVIDEDHAIVSENMGPD